MEKLLTIAEVAKALRVHSSTVRNWTNKGLLHACYIGTRNDRRFKQKDIDDFINR